MGKLVQSRQLIKIVFSLLIFSSIAVFLVQSDLSAIGSQLRKIGFRFIYVLLSTVLAYLFGTLAWWICLGKMKNKISIPALFAIRQIGETVGLFNPASVIGGDWVKADLVSRYGIPGQKAVDAVAIARITAVLSQLTLFLAAVFWLMFSPLKKGVMRYTGNSIYGVCIVLFVLVIVIFCWLISTKAPPKPADIPLDFWNRTKVSIETLLWRIREFYQQQNRVFWYAYLLSAIHWLAGSVEFYLLLTFMGVDVSLMHGLLLDMSVIILKSTGAFIPGQLGIEELSNKLLLTMIGVGGGSLWLSISILRRARQVFWIALSAVFYLCIKRKKRYATV